EVVREAEWLNIPLREVLPGAAAVAPQPLVELTGAGVEISAVKRADDGSGDLVVRLAEMCGARTPVTVRLPRRIEDARRCNLLEELQSAIDTGDGIVAITVQPFELVTLRLR
ncbi:MAG: glycosyl hydrolase-related protein, partial [Actinomycetota bacterium]